MRSYRESEKKQVRWDWEMKEEIVTGIGLELDKRRLFIEDSFVSSFSLWMLWENETVDERERERKRERERERCWDDAARDDSWWWWWVMVRCYNQSSGWRWKRWRREKERKEDMEDEQKESSGRLEERYGWAQDQLWLLCVIQNCRVLSVQQSHEISTTNSAMICLQVSFPFSLFLALPCGDFLRHLSIFLFFIFLTTSSSSFFPFHHYDYGNDLLLLIFFFSLSLFSSFLQLSLFLAPSFMSPFIIIMCHSIRIFISPGLVFTHSRRHIASAYLYAQHHH